MKKQIITMMLLVSMFVSLFANTATVNAATPTEDKVSKSIGRTLSVTNEGKYSAAEDSTSTYQFTEKLGEYDVVYTISFSGHWDNVFATIEEIGIYNPDGSVTTDKIPYFSVPDKMYCPNMTFYTRDKNWDEFPCGNKDTISLEGDNFLKEDFQASFETLLIPYSWYDLCNENEEGVSEGWSKFGYYNGFIDKLVLPDVYSHNDEYDSAFLSNIIGTYATNGCIDDTDPNWEHILGPKAGKGRVYDLDLLRKFVAGEKVSYVDETTYDVEEVEEIDEEEIEEVQDGYGQYTNIKGEYEELLMEHRFIDDEYYLYMVNDKDFIFRSRFSIVNDEVVIKSTNIYDYSKDYEEISVNDDYNGSLGTFTYPTTILVNGKKYPVTTMEDCSLLLYNENSYLDKVVIPNGVKKIDFFSFAPINELVISDSVETIGRSPFENVKKVSISKDNTHLKMKDGWLLSGDETILYGSYTNKNRSKVAIPNTVVTIKKGALSNLKLVEYGLVVFPKTLKTIEELVFSNFDVVTLRFKSSTPPTILETDGDFYCITPNKASVIKAYQNLKDNNGNAIFGKDKVITKLYKNMKKTFAYWDKNITLFTKKPDCIPDADWKEIKKIVANLTKNCKTTKEKVDVIYDYCKNLEEVDIVNQNNVYIPGCYSYHRKWLSALKQKQCAIGDKDRVLILLLKAANIPCDSFDFRIKDSDGVHEKLASVCPFYKIGNKWHMDCKDSLMYYDTKSFEVESFVAYVSYVCYFDENLDFTGTMVEFLPYSWGLEV